MLGIISFFGGILVTYACIVACFSLFKICKKLVDAGIHDLNDAVDELTKK